MSHRELSKAVQDVAALAGWTPSRGPLAAHALRVSGAQFMARRGLPAQHIQLLGRWSSNALE
eukprot:6088421-Amphidinium_carterae.1